MKRLNIGIIGLGLIGGSFSKAFKLKDHNIFGLDLDEKTISLAKNSGIFEDVCLEIDDLLKHNLDLLYIALPIEAAKEVVLHLGDIDCDIPITDALSTKESIEKLASNFDLTFCGGHPIAGREKSGFEHSDPDIFKNAVHILTNKNAPHYELLEALHKEIGMRVIHMDPKEHDRIFSLVSHFPHLAAFLLVEIVQKKDPEAFSFSGGGFKDFTRIAGSDPTMWSNIFIDNKENLINIIDDYIELLEEWKQLISSQNRKQLYSKIEKISNIRRGM
ncbi:MAG: prephenate dehydrogenase/arogenate dehydrogenase family protein [Calditerrivibrio sp.]|nr:prephenate dehydrogenase/arogenate dehydrogenase family protein [Calditerrivibrio sp.]